MCQHPHPFAAVPREQILKLAASALQQSAGARLRNGSSLAESSCWVQRAGVMSRLNEARS